jgi:hypothetical protein
MAVYISNASTVMFSHAASAGKFQIGKVSGNGPILAASALTTGAIYRSDNSTVANVVALFRPSKLTFSATGATDALSFGYGTYYPTYSNSPIALGTYDPTPGRVLVSVSAASRLFFTPSTTLSFDPSTDVLTMNGYPIKITSEVGIGYSTHNGIVTVGIESYTGTDSIAIGYRARAYSNAISIGYCAGYSASAVGSIFIGENAGLNGGSYSVMIGRNASACGTYSVGVGDSVSLTI